MIVGIKDQTADCPFVLLTFEGYTAHTSVRILELHWLRGIMCFAFLPNTSCQIQSFDVELCNMSKL